jgi:hypothetical protein
VHMQGAPRVIGIYRVRQSSICSANGFTELRRRSQLDAPLEHLTAQLMAQGQLDSRRATTGPRLSTVPARGSRPSTFS